MDHEHALPMKTPMTSSKSVTKSVKRKRLQTIQAPEFRIFQDVSVFCEDKTTEKTAEPVKPTMNAMETQTTPIATPHNRESFGGRVREALKILADATDAAHASLPTYEAQAQAPATVMKPAVETHSMSASPMTPAMRMDMDVGTTPSLAPPAPVIETNTMSTSMTPINMQHAQTSTTPLAAVSAVLALMENASPATMRGQVETLSISNEILRDNQQSLQREIEIATQRENALRADAEAAKAQLSHAIATATADTNRLSSMLSHKEEELAATRARLSQLESMPRLSAEDAAEADSMRQSLTLLSETIADLEGQLANAASAIEAAKQAERVALETAQAEAAKAEKHSHLNKMLQEDLKLTYNKHKQELAKLEHQYKHEAYSTRYHAVLQKASAAEGMASAFMALQPDLERLTMLEASVMEVLNSQMANIQRQSAEIVEARATMDEEARALQDINAALQEDLRRTLTELESTTARLAEREAMAQELAVECEALRDTITELNEKLSAALDHSALESRIHIMEGEKQELITLIEALQSAAAGKEEELSNLRSEIDLLAEQQTMMEVAIEQQKQAASAQENARLRAETETLRAALQQRDDCIAKLTEQVDEQARHHAELRDFIAEERLVRQEVIEDSEREATTLRQTVETLKEQLAAATEQLETQREQHDKAMQDARVASERALKDKDLELVHIQTSMAQLGGELVDKELQAFEARAAIDPMRKQLDDAQVRLAEMEKAMAQKDHDVTYLKDYLRTFQERSQEKINTLQSNLAKAEAEVQELDEALARAMAPRA